MKRATGNVNQRARPNGLARSEAAPESVLKTLGPARILRLLLLLDLYSTLPDRILYCWREAAPDYALNRLAGPGWSHIFCLVGQAPFLVFSNI